MIGSTPWRRRPRGLASALALGAVGLLLACGGGGGGAADPDAFLVASSDPTANALGVPVDASVLVTFSQALDPATVTAGSLRVGEIQGSGEVSGTTVLVDDGTARTLRWDPAEEMAPTTSHECQLSRDLRSVGGRALEPPYAIPFRTGGAPPPPDLPRPTDLRQTVGRLITGRRSHTATLLESGQVLIAGGFTQGTQITNRAETYQAELFAELDARMVEERASHTATRLLDGRVLLTGGWYEAAIGFLATTDGAEVYDPVTESFSAVEPMHSERVDHAAALLPDGRVLITGGSRLVGSFLEDLDTAEVFDPAAGTFTLLEEPMVHTRATHAMVDMENGKIVLVGGSDEDSRASWFDVATERFEALAVPPSERARWGPAADRFASGAVSVAGGDRLGTVLYVHPDTGFVQPTTSGLNAPRYYASATRIGPDQVLVAGGFDFSRGLFILSSCDIVVEGGLGGSRTYATDLRFLTGLVYHTATRLADGSVLFCGGLNQEGGLPELDAAYILDR